MAPLDRRKHAVDVLEHVLEGVRTRSTASAGSDGPADEASAAPARHTTRQERESGDERRPDPHDGYESDRRGEHQYPDSNTDARRPSHRARRALKRRLERGS